MDIIKDRIKNAVEILKTGNSYQVGDIRLRMDIKRKFLGLKTERKLYVGGPTAYSNLDFLTKDKALKELSDIKLRFNELIDNSEELKGLVQDISIEYHLTEADDKCGVTICYEENGQINWYIDAKKDLLG